MPKYVFEPGEGYVTGIWLWQASRMTHSRFIDTTAAIIRNVFFDFTPTRAGSVTFGIFIDGKQTGEITGTTFEAKDIGKPLPFAFWYPARARIKGKHEVTIKVGNQVLKEWFIFSLQKTEYKDNYDFIVNILEGDE